MEAILGIGLTIFCLAFPISVIRDGASKEYKAKLALRQRLG